MIGKVIFEKIKKNEPVTNEDIETLKIFMHEKFEELMAKIQNENKKGDNK